MLKDFSKQIILILIASTSGYFINEYKTSIENRLQYLDYVIISTEDVFNRFSSPKPLITVKTPEKEVNKVTQIEIIFKNMTDHDFEDIPIYIEFDTKKNLNPEIIGRSLLGANGLDENISTLKKNHLLNSGQTIRESFIIKTFNRDIQWEDNPKATFLFEGGTTPEINIKIDKKGMAIRKYDDNNYKSIYNNIYFILLLYILLLVTYHIFIQYRKILRIKKNRRKEVSYIKNYILANKNSFSNNDIFDAKKVALEIDTLDYTDYYKEYIKHLESFLSENKEVMQNCNEKTAHEFAKRILINNRNYSLRNRAKWKQFIYPIPKPDWDELDS